MARILIVEDNVANLQLMTYLLSAFGHTIVQALNGEECLEKIDEEDGDFALILCDIQLPKLNGYGVARRLKADVKRRHLPLVAVTALAMVGDRDKVMGAGFDGYITKPIAPELFLSQVDEYLNVEDRAARVPERAQGVKETQQPRETTREARILVVDNVRSNLELIRSILESAGYPVKTASGVHEGLCIADAWHPDAVISDLHMPDIDGLDFVRVLRSHKDLADVPFVLTSASSPSPQERDAISGLKVGKLIELPVDPHTLLEQIEQAICK